MNDGVYACPSCGNVYDNPEDDATDAAHPAWWRGHDHGAAGAAMALLDVARDGVAPGAGYAAPIVVTVFAIEDLRAKVVAAEARVKELEEQVRTYKPFYDSYHR